MKRVLVALAMLGACAEVTTLRYQPSKAPVVARVDDHGISTVSRPARGGTLATTLADGFPVWVVHHHDGTITVVSGVAPVRPKGTGYLRDDVSNQVGRYLVSWIPGVRRFYSSGVLFDEYGTVLVRGVRRVLRRVRADRGHAEDAARPRYLRSHHHPR